MVLRMSFSEGRTQTLPGQAEFPLLTSVMVTQPNAALQNRSMLIQNNCTELGQLMYVKGNLTQKNRFAAGVLDNRTIKVLKEHFDFLGVFILVS